MVQGVIDHVELLPVGDVCQVLLGSRPDPAAADIVVHRFTPQCARLPSLHILHQLILLLPVGTELFQHPESESE